MSLLRNTLGNWKWLLLFPVVLAIGIPACIVFYGLEGIRFCLERVITGIYQVQDFIEENVRFVLRPIKSWVFKGK